jgi:hypothetical protein
LTYRDPDILDKFGDELPRRYEVFKFPIGYKPVRSDYIRIVLERALEWKKYWEGVIEKERMEGERRRKLVVRLAPFRDRVAREFADRYAKIVKEFEDRAKKLNLSDEPVLEWIDDLRFLVFDKPKHVKSERDVEEAIQEIEKLIEKIDKELKRLEEFEDEWERLSPEERKRRAEEAERMLRKLILGEIE